MPEVYFDAPDVSTADPALTRVQVRLDALFPGRFGDLRLLGQGPLDDRFSAIDRRTGDPVAVNLFHSRWDDPGPGSGARDWR
ncbi:MAG TPA: hypothetical protein VEI97_17645, partial [bacterium]|nr:hypothetical protein [bacterium]